MKTVLAVHAHPDDIEFVMAGTLFLLKSRGCDVHTMNVCTGSCGTAILSREEIVAIRREEAVAAARVLGSTHHPSVCDDLEVFYSDELIRRICSVVRTVKPDILLAPSPEDYMEDHMNVSRLVVTAAFARGMRNYPSQPPASPTEQDIALYHAMPHGLSDGLGRRIYGDFYVDIADVLPAKAQMLSCHKSQSDWLDRTQGMGSYVETMKDLSGSVGSLSGTYSHAEGWRRHNYLGFSQKPITPLEDILSDRITS